MTGADLESRLPPLGYQPAAKIFKRAASYGPLVKVAETDCLTLIAAARSVLEVAGNDARYAVDRLTSDAFEQGPVNDLAAMSIASRAASDAEAAAHMILIFVGTAALPHGKETEAFYQRAMDATRVVGNVALFCRHLAGARAFRVAAALGDPLLFFAAADQFRLAADAAREARLPLEGDLLDYAAREADKEGRHASPDL